MRQGRARSQKELADKTRDRAYLHADWNETSLFGLSQQFNARRIIHRFDHQEWNPERTHARARFHQLVIADKVMHRHEGTCPRKAALFSSKRG